MQMENRYIETDVLVIGGGSAGCLAAHRLLEINPEMKVHIFDTVHVNFEKTTLVILWDIFAKKYKNVIL